MYSNWGEPEQAPVLSVELVRMSHAQKFPEKPGSPTLDSW